MYANILTLGRYYLTSLIRGAEEGRRVEGSRALLGVIGLNDEASSLGPEALKAQDQVLEGERLGRGGQIGLGRGWKKTADHRARRRALQHAQGIYGSGGGEAGRGDPGGRMGGRQGGGGGGRVLAGPAQAEDGGARAGHPRQGHAGGRRHR